MWDIDMISNISGWLSWPKLLATSNSFAGKRFKQPQIIVLNLFVVLFCFLLKIDTNLYFPESLIFLTYVWVNLEVTEMCDLFRIKGFPLLKVKEFVKSEKVKCFIMKPSSHRFPTATLRSTTSWISAGFLSQRFQILLGNNFAGLS